MLENNINYILKLYIVSQAIILNWFFNMEFKKLTNYNFL